VLPECTDLLANFGMETVWDQPADTVCVPVHMLSSCAWMVLSTNGFESLVQLNRHFGEHGNDFGASNPADYEQMADTFLSGDKPETVHECARPGGTKIRYDPTSEAFGIIDNGGIIRTYFKPIPCSLLPGSMREVTRQAGRCHRYANNLVYFKAECQK